MRMWRTYLWAFVLLTTFRSPAQTPPSILQRGYDPAVSGANLSEKILNVGNVNTATFGLQFTLPVDDNVYAQPLYVPGVTIFGQGVHNVLLVATMSDSLLAFDADTGVELWSVNFASSVGAMPVPIAKFLFGNSTNPNIIGNLGILSTPVIDPSTLTLYLVAATLENSTIVYRLHAVNIMTGTEPYTNTVISGSYNGIAFDAPHQTQRVSLAITDNQVVFGFGSIQLESSDKDGYSGWVMAYSETTLAQTGIFATVTKGKTLGGGVWQSGRPPAVDSSGYVYAYVGNGFKGGGGYDGVNNFNESALKLDPSNGLKLVDWFTPSIWSAMDADDGDLGVSGPLVIPGTSLIAGGGKPGILYVLDTGHMGQFSSTDAGAVQTETVSAGFIEGGPVFWQISPANGVPLLFDWGKNDYLKAYAFTGTGFGSSPVSEATSLQIHPGGMLALSANADAPKSGVLWTNGASGAGKPAPGMLRAYQATNLTRELWNSQKIASRDSYGNYATWAVPVVANGRVYVATFSDQVAVYGLLSSYSLSATSLAFGNQALKTASSSQSVTLTNTGSVALPLGAPTMSTKGTHPFSQTNTCGTSIAAGGQCSISFVFDPAVTGSATTIFTVIPKNGIAVQTVTLNGTGVASN